MILWEVCSQHPSQMIMVIEEDKPLLLLKEPCVVIFSLSKLIHQRDRWEKVQLILCNVTFKILELCLLHIL